MRQDLRRGGKTKGGGQRQENELTTARKERRKMGRVREERKGTDTQRKPYQVV